MEATTINIIFSALQILGFSLLIYGFLKLKKGREKLQKKLVLTNAYEKCQRELQPIKENLETYVIDYNLKNDSGAGQLSTEELERILKAQASEEIADTICKYLIVNYTRRPYQSKPDISVRARVLFKVVNENPSDAV